jgi:hypothetical protein
MKKQNARMSYYESFLYSVPVKANIPIPNINIKIGLLSSNVIQETNFSNPKKVIEAPNVTAKENKIGNRLKIEVRTGCIYASACPITFAVVESIVFNPVSSMPEEAFLIFFIMEFILDFVL